MFYWAFSLQNAGVIPSTGMTEKRRCNFSPEQRPWVAEGRYTASERGPAAPGDTDGLVYMNTHAAVMLNKQGQNECQKGFSFVFSKGKRLSDCSN